MLFSIKTNLVSFFAQIVAMCFCWSYDAPVIFFLLLITATCQGAYLGCLLGDRIARTMVK